MIERRREKLVLDALQDVVRSLRGAREERKAILTISNGWRLFRPNESLQRVLPGRRPPDGLPPVGIDPRTAGLRPTTRRHLRAPPIAPPATAIAWLSPESTTPSSSATSPRKRTEPTPPFIRSIHAASPRSTSRS